MGEDELRARLIEALRPMAEWLAGEGSRLMDAYVAQGINGAEMFANYGCVPDAPPSPERRAEGSVSDERAASGPLGVERVVEDVDGEWEK